MDEQTQQGAVWLTGRAVTTEDARPLDELAEWAAGQADGLAALEGLVPDATADAVGRSLTLLAEVGARTGGLEAALACPAGPAVDGSDDLGPLPAPCPAPEPTPAPTGGGTPGPGTGTVPEVAAPEGTDPELPPVPPNAGPGTGSDGTGGLPTPAVPRPTPGELVPSLPRPLPGNGSGGASGSSSAVVQVPPVGPIQVCAPPLVTVGC
jgi:hypothetical protein